MPPASVIAHSAGESNNHVPTGRSARIKYKKGCARAGNRSIQAFFLISVWVMSYKYPRLYVSDPILDGQEINLLGSQVHYLKSVLRLEADALVRIFNGQDGEWLAKFNPINKKNATLTPCEQTHQQTNKGLNKTHLIFAPIKKQRLDFMIEKAIELGATDLHPVVTHNTEVRKINADRIQAQIIEATEQCERLDLARLHPLNTLDKFCASWEESTPLFAAIERGDAPLLSSIDIKNDTAILIGPEGGFTQQETEMLQNFKAIQAVSLGDNILRAETAALYGLSHLVKH